MGWTLEDALSTCGDYRLVDEVVAASDDELTARIHLPAAADYHRTDGRGRALLVPGTVLLELAVQSGEALIHRGRGRPDGDGVPVLARVRSVAFRRPVAPDTELEARVRLTDRVGPAFYVRADLKRGSEKVMTAELTFTATTAIEGADGS